MPSLKHPTINEPSGFFADFPKLRGALRHPSSFATDRYNCIAFAADDKKLNWWPGKYEPGWFWPPNCPNELTVAAFVETFRRHLGYEVCDTYEFEPGVEKVAIYEMDGEPRHAAKQPADRGGKWKSKIGRNVDIEHKLEDLEGPLYGRVVCVMRRVKRKKNDDGKAQAQPAK